MALDRPLLDKLRKVEALSADAAATAGEKAAASAAADRIRARWLRRRGERRRTSDQAKLDVMYLLGRTCRKIMSRW
jgi:hypothetical protein